MPWINILICIITIFPRSPSIIIYICIFINTHINTISLGYRIAVYISIDSHISTRIDAG